MTKERTFTVESSCINISGGRYKSSSPISAAKKAASRLLKQAKQNPKHKTLRKITFCIRETTSGSTKDLYHYKASRTKLATPVVRIINGIQIINHYKIEITSVQVKQRKSSLKCEKTKTKKKGGTFISNEDLNTINSMIEFINQNLNDGNQGVYLQLFENGKLKPFTRNSTIEDINTLREFIYYYFPINTNEYVNILSNIYSRIMKDNAPFIPQGNTDNEINSEMAYGPM